MSTKVPSFRLIRSASGMDQKAFAAKLGVSHTWLSQVENGHKTPKVSNSKAMVERLGISYEAFALVTLDDPRELVGEELDLFHRLQGSLMARLIYIAKGGF